MEPSSYCPFHCVNVVEGGDFKLQVSQTGGVESIRPVGEVQTLVFPALSSMVTWQFDPSALTVHVPPDVWIPLCPSVELESVKFTDVFPQPVVAGFQLPQEGSTLSIFAVGEVQTLEFPAWSRMVTSQLSPLYVAVQLPPSTSIQLPPVSVELERVNVTFDELQEFPLGLHDPHVGSMLSCAAKTKEWATMPITPIPERNASDMPLRFPTVAEPAAMLL